MTCFTSPAACPPGGWRDQALCAQTDPELFYPGTGDRQAAAAARRVCRSCPVQLECLQDAIDGRERWGIRGGLMPRQRRPLERLARELARLGPMPSCPVHGLVLSGGPVLYRCDGGPGRHHVMPAAPRAVAGLGGKAA